jgi:glycosyltransferase involved in cell wall biosynthesis
LNQNKIRILHLVQRYFPRGAEIFAVQLADALAIRGNYNAACSLYKSETANFHMPGSIVSISLGFNEHGILAKMGFQPLLLLKLVNVIRKIKPDIVIAHGADTLRYTALTRLFYPGVRAIYRNIDIASFWARNRFKAWMVKQFLRGIHAVASVSQVSRDDFRALYKLPTEKVVAIVNGVDLTPYRNLEIDEARRRVRDKLGISENDIILISVGSLCYQKNQEELFKLLMELKQPCPHLFLVGDGPKRQEFEKIVNDSGLEKQVSFLGVQTDVASYFAASDIFVLPSRTEGMPAVLIEAGAAGLPSVAYDVGGVKEVISQGITGTVVPARDHEGFKSALNALLFDPEKRRQMGDLARQTYFDRFDIKVIAAEYEALALKLLRGKGRFSDAS